MNKFNTLFILLITAFTLSACGSGSDDSSGSNGSGGGLDHPNSDSGSGGTDGGGTTPDNDSSGNNGNHLTSMISYETKRKKVMTHSTEYKYTNNGQIKKLSSFDGEDKTPSYTTEYEYNSSNELVKITTNTAENSSVAVTTLTYANGLLASGSTSTKISSNPDSNSTYKFTVLERQDSIASKIMHEYFDASGNKKSKTTEVRTIANDKIIKTKDGEITRTYTYDSGNTRNPEKFSSDSIFKGYEVFLTKQVIEGIQESGVKWKRINDYSLDFTKDSKGRVTSLLKTNKVTNFSGMDRDNDGQPTVNTYTSFITYQYALPSSF